MVTVGCCFLLYVALVSGADPDCVKYASGVCDGDPNCQTFGIYQNQIQFHGCADTVPNNDWTVWNRTSHATYTQLPGHINVESSECAKYPHTSLDNCPASPPTVSYPCDPGEPGAQLPFCNTSLSYAARVEDLVSRIPPGSSEKYALFNTGSGGVESLGLGKFQWWSEGLHGVRCGHGIDCAGGVNTTTIFPQPIGSAAAFNRSLWRAIGDTIATEFRAFSNAGRGFLSIFSPNINILRDPRWGRGQVHAGLVYTVARSSKVLYRANAAQRSEFLSLHMHLWCRKLLGNVRISVLNTQLGM
jgi:hypothetical protein